MTSLPMPTPIAAAVAGSMVMIGIFLAIYGLQRRPDGRNRRRRRPLSMKEAWAVYTRRPAGRAGRVRDTKLAISFGVGLVVWALTGWLVAILIAPAAVFGLPILMGKAPQNEIALLEALDRWVRSIGQMLPIGRDVSGAIQETVASAPELLRPGVERLVRRLNSGVPTDEALHSFADELGHPEADAVVAALQMASRRTGLGLEKTLNGLADSLQDRVQAAREIEQERDRPRQVVRMVTAISAVLIGGALLLGNFFDAYTTNPLGQVVLFPLAGAYVGSLWWMYRMTKPKRRPRVLTAVDDGHEAEVLP